MKRLPRLALILLSAEWFDSVLAAPGLTELLRADAAAIQKVLTEHFELAAFLKVNDAASLGRAGDELRRLELDLAVLAFQVWAEDWYLQPLGRALVDTPLVVWCYQPWRKPPRPARFVEVLRGSGAVGTLEGLGTLRNLGVDYQFVYGAPEEPRLVADLRRWALAALVRRDLQRARFGLLPYRNEQMQSTFVDEFRLRAELGPSLEYLAVSELEAISAALDDGEVSAFVDQLRRAHPINGVQPEALRAAARASLGLAHLAAAHRLDLLSLNDIAPDLHRVLGLRPTLYPPLWEEAGMLIGLEGDLGAAVAIFLLDRLAGGPLMFCEFWYWDEEENVLVGGHAGVMNPALAAHATIIPDAEFAQSDRLAGAHYHFIARAGRVTLLHLRATPHVWQAIAASGESLGGDPWLEGYPHAAVRLDAPVGQFLQRAAALGSTQHFILTYGDLLPEVRAACRLLHIPLEVIQAPGSASEE